MALQLQIANEKLGKQNLKNRKSSEFGLKGFGREENK